MIERIFWCDGPPHERSNTDDVPGRCGAHQRSASESPSPPRLWIELVWGGEALHFCSMDCVLRYAAAYPAAVVIPSGADD